MNYFWCLSLCVFGGVLCIEQDFKGFDDSILFNINWPGSPENLESLVDGKANKIEKEILKVNTSNKERYECHLPELKPKVKSSFHPYEGPTPLKLLDPLFEQKMCSYKLESYWSYEVCHGKYVRQYHEERDGRVIKMQEFYLGHWSPEKQRRLEAELKASQATKEAPPYLKLEGVPTPYLEMVMEDGTLCDLSGRPRLTRVKYVCYTHGKHDVYSFKETSTCEYEVIILSGMLCGHPQFKPKEVGENSIDCIPVGDAPKKPRNLLKMEVESLRFHHQTIRLMNNDKDAKDILAVLKVEKIDKDGETHLKFELHPLNEDEEITEGTEKPALLEKPAVISDDSPVRAFLNGENCLNGGIGWWKYEFCYGKHVVQYHVDRTGEKTTVLLGRYHEQQHLDWIQENRGKAPKPLQYRTSVSHFYSDGDICDKTGKPRQTEVKLKCLENSSSPAQVSLYLIEPRTCHYILGVESPLICELLPLADENGLIPDKPVELKGESTEQEVKSEDEVYVTKKEGNLGND